MFVLIVLAGVDWLLPDVRIPVYGWVLLVFLWVLKKSVQEAAAKSPKKKEPAAVPEIFTPEQAWITHPDDADLLSQADGDWSIYRRDGKFYLFGNETQELNLTATTVGAAMDQADVIIAALTVED